MSTKKIKTTNEEQLKVLQQKQKALIQEHKNKMGPFVRFLKKKQLKFNHARVGNSRIQYFRLDQFQKLLQRQKQQIGKQQSLRSVLKQIKQQLIFFKRPINIKSKYPSELQPTSSQSPQKKYASFRYDTTQSKSWMTIALIVAVLSLVLFQIWPYWLKYGIWLLSFLTLIVLLTLIGLRLVIYVLCVIFGYNVWIFPNLMGEYGFFESFKPFVYYEKWERNWYNTLIRVFVISSIVAYSCYLYLNPTVFYENLQLTKQTVTDIHDWGVSKIKNQKNFSQRAITNLDVILNETADVSNSDYTSFDETMQNNL